MKSPFKFLDSYTKDDRKIFFGREIEIEELYQKVFESKILLVYGVSGTGKSSLIHCGLANKFQDTDWLPIVIRQGGNIIESMASAIKSDSITSQKNKFVSPADFKKGVRSLYLDHYKPVFFIFDQFEELFIFGNKEERRAFIHIVKTLTESDLQCRMIFIMREEYMAGVTEFEKYIPTFFSNRVRIEKMSHRNALEAIKGPCKVSNISMEEGFAETLLEKLSPGESDVELTYLQVFLDKIFRLAQVEKSEDPGKLLFTLELLQKTGNVSDLLGSFLDEQISLLGNPEGGLAVLKSFVSVKGSRRQMLPEEVSEYAQTLGKPIKEQELKDLLQTFVNLRILHDKDQNRKYELRHDALATKIYEKISLIEKEILEIRQLIDNSYHSWIKRGILISSEDLNYIAPYESRLFLPEKLADLLDRSKKALISQKQRRRNLVFLSGIVLMIGLAGFTVWSIIESNKTKKQETLARANYFTSLSKEFANSDPTKALRIAEYANKLNPTEENRRNLVSIYSGNEFYRTFLPYMVSNLREFYFFRSMNNSGGVAAMDRDEIRIFSKEGIILKSVPVDFSPYSFEISPDGKFLLLNVYDDTIRLYDLKENSLFKIKSSTDVRLRSWHFDMGFFQDSRRFLTINNSKEITVWSITGEVIARSDKFEKYSLIINPAESGKLLVCSLAGILYSWKLNVNRISETKLELGKDNYIRNPASISDGRIALYRTDKKICIYDTAGKCRTEWPIDYQPQKIIPVAGHNSFITWSNNIIDLWDYSGNNIKTIRSGSAITDVQYDKTLGLVLFSSENRISSFTPEGSRDSLLLKTGNETFFNSLGDTNLVFQTVEKQVGIYNNTFKPQNIFSLSGNNFPPFYSRSVKYLAYGSYSKPFLTLFDLENNTVINPGNFDRKPYVVSFSKNSRFFAASGKVFADSTLSFIDEYAEDFLIL
ncbi:MAG: AAA family ATPase, partial [Bacteroidales bacterium]